MQRLVLSTCHRCQRSFFQTDISSIKTAGQLYSRRFRSRAATRDTSKFPQRSQSNTGHVALATKGTANGIYNPRVYFEGKVASWARLPRVHHRLKTFGISDNHIVPLLNAFVKEVQSGRLSTDEGFTKYNLNRFLDNFPSGRTHEFADRIFTNIFYTWASDPDMQLPLEKLTSMNTILAIQRLYAAADLSYPAEAFYFARTLRRRVIMHVGPTNSGKTHNALRALASAKIGLYAGPLRLLAHEIWERLNLGQIVPLGVEPEADTLSDVGLNSDIADESNKDAPTARHDRNPKYVRLCNLLTGEEYKVVDEGATLLSCTVEMVSSTAEYDVAVIDEIQMLADPERGGAWTNAFLGMCAKEIHLCGEETAVPLVEELIKDTGDVLTVHRYQRLTPLVVEQDSLEGDLSRVRKGDCIVTFSRTAIFGLKRQVEEITGLRCAVAYGRLPPEIRSEQAALFNDPNSGYDVMIGSDAIGMGLNLKIKRIIFESVRKFDGRTERPLSSSQMKQIAGRAGRYGLLGDDSPGLVTTLRVPDLPVLREALAAPVVPLRYAYLSSTTKNITAVAQALPPRATTSTIYEVNVFVSKVRALYRFVDYPRLATMASFIDTKGRDLTLDDRSLLMMAPIPWQDEDSLAVVSQFLRMYQSTMRVVFLRSIEGSQFIQRVIQVEDMMASGVPPVSSSATLIILEAFHKMLVLYMWLSFRNPISFGDHVEVAELKGRVEKALDWCLAGASAKRETRLLIKSPQVRNREIPWTSGWAMKRGSSNLTSTKHKPSESATVHVTDARRIGLKS